MSLGTSTDLDLDEADGAAALLRTTGAVRERAERLMRRARGRVTVVRRR